MRRSIQLLTALAITTGLAAVGVTACTGTISGGSDHATLESRVRDACSELASVCAGTGHDCTAQAAFCGTLSPQLAPIFSTESTCKAACTDSGCQKTCKADRVATVSALLTRVDLNQDGVAGDGSSACTEMQQTCTSTSDGCSATEFFCTLARPVQDACSTELAACKLPCGHDHSCKAACKEAYFQCEAGTTTTPPDAGTTTPDAPTTMPDAGTTTPDAAPPPPPPPATAYTYTTDIKPKMTGLCNGCHSGSPPAGYFTDSYAGLFGNGSDNTPNIIPGNGSSLFVVKIQGNHHNVLSQYPGFGQVVYDWVVLNAAKQ